MDVRAWHGTVRRTHAAPFLWHGTDVHHLAGPRRADSAGGGDPARFENRSAAPARAHASERQRPLARGLSDLGHADENQLGARPVAPRRYADRDSDRGALV